MPVDPEFAQEDKISRSSSTKEDAKSCRVGLAPPLPLPGGTRHTLGTRVRFSPERNARNDSVIPAHAGIQVFLNRR